MTLHDYLAVFVVDGCNRALDKQGRFGVHIAERAIRDTLLGLLDEAKERFPLLGVEMDKIDLKEILKALLPLLQLAAAKTPNVYDDWIVAFLAKYVATGETPAAIMAALPPPPTE